MSWDNTPDQVEAVPEGGMLARLGRLRLRLAPNRGTLRTWRGDGTAYHALVPRRGYRRLARGRASDHALDLLSRVQIPSG